MRGITHRMLNNSSEKRLSQVHPELARRVRLAITELNGQELNIQVVQGLRSFDEQNVLYAQGRTAPGKIVTNAKGGYSNHNFGLAVDLCPFLSDGKPHWSASEGTWKAIGKAAERQGLEWGGRWKTFVDRPHVQLPGLSVADCRALYRQGGLPLVWDRATKARAAAEGVTEAPAKLTPKGSSESIQTGHKATPVPAQTITVTNPTGPTISAQVTPLPQAPKTNSPNSVGLVGKALLGYRITQALAGGSAYAAIFWQQYKTPLLHFFAFCAGLLLAWNFKPLIKKEIS
jgi:peptidoglycan L-alanyl-D-glutamate endopeptidase CwlK